MLPSCLASRCSCWKLRMFADPLQNWEVSWGKCQGDAAVSQSLYCKYMVVFSVDSALSSMFACWTLCSLTAYPGLQLCADCQRTQILRQGCARTVPTLLRKDLRCYILLALSWETNILIKVKWEAQVLLCLHPINKDKRGLRQGQCHWRGLLLTTRPGRSGGWCFFLTTSNHPKHSSWCNEGS